MPTAGTRAEGTCKGCGKKILFIYAPGGKWIPCESLPSAVDGERMLVFADGVQGRRHGDREVGHEVHFKNCPNATNFRKSKLKKANAKTSEKQAGEKEGEEKVRAAVLMCGCFGGEDSTR